MLKAGQGENKLVLFFLISLIFLVVGIILEKNIIDVLYFIFMIVFFLWFLIIRYKK